MDRRSSSRVAPILLIAAAAATGTAFAVQQPEARAVDSVLFVKPELIMRADYVRASEFEARFDGERLQRLGTNSSTTLVDRLTGRPATLYPSTPLLPGRGVGNTLSWRAQAPRDRISLEQAAVAAFRDYVADHAADLGVETAELAWPGKTVALSDELVNLFVPRVVGGIEVRDSYLSASIRHGNLVLVGTENWGDFDGIAVPDLTAEDAREILRRHVGERLWGRGLKAPSLVFVPLRTDGDEGLTYRLVWVLLNDLREPGGRFEALVDAGNGELLSLRDDRHYVAAPRRAQGGVYPVSNDQVPPDGQEQTGWPMPFSFLTFGPDTFTTDIGGNAPTCLDGSATTVLSGPYVDMADVCGAESLASTANNLDWLSGPAPSSTDCTTPGVGGPGNTKSSRTGFHELNMLAAMARAQLPSNAWLQSQLTANMNIPDPGGCNAFWNGSTVNFYRSVPSCRNTGEIAAVFDHEWGHGMDNNDAVPSVSSPGEGIADIYSTLRLNDSCVARGFFNAGNCSGYGDPCIACSGIRDVDWAQRASGNPHDIIWINNNCGSGTAPCGGGVHCEGSVYGESVWDLWNRDLTAAPFSYTVDRAREVATYLTYNGATAVGSQWYTCDVTAPFDGGCGATTGYQKYLVADDDNGNLADGTPHMTAIYAAFNRTKIACQAIAPVNSGCAGAPASAPVVTAAPHDKRVDLSWTSVAGTTEYEVFRTDGVFGCNFGKIKIATTAGTTFVDTGLQNGREYSYIVVPKGATDSCFGPASTCTSATPIPGPSLATSAAASFFDVLNGDADAFLDNCEVVRVSLPVSNTGSATVTNPRIVSAVSTSHPGSTLLTSLPEVITPSLAACADAVGEVQFQASGLTAGDTFEVDLELTADEFAPSTQVVHVVAGLATEGDFVATPTFTWSFTADAEGWVTEEGTFVRSNSGAGTPGNAGFFFQSSANLGNQCDSVRSPLLQMTATSTLSLSNHFDIEPFYAPGGVWYDRANLAFRPVATGVATPLSPSSGRTYNASGANGNCGTTGQPGWAGTFTTWAASNWTSGALQTGVLGGQAGHFVIRYGTDPMLHPSGFRFDTVTLTDFDLAGPDGQSDVCVPDTMPFLDGFESGDTSQWSVTLPLVP